MKQKMIRTPRGLSTQTESRGWQGSDVDIESDNRPVLDGHDGGASARTLGGSLLSHLIPDFTQEFYIDQLRSLFMLYFVDLRFTLRSLFRPGTESGQSRGLPK
jgi:hypothetical protein